MVFLNEKEEKDMCKINSDFINIVMRYKLIRDFFRISDINHLYLTCKRRIDTGCVFR